MNEIKIDLMACQLVEANFCHEVNCQRLSGFFFFGGGGFLQGSFLTLLVNCLLLSGFGVTVWARFVE